MAYEAGLAQMGRDTLADHNGVTERKMFGGICFMLDGNMLCGAHPKGAMFRVGKALAPEALKIDGVTPMQFTGRPMGGMVDVSDDCMQDDARRRHIMQLALAFVGALPAK